MLTCLLSVLLTLVEFNCENLFDCQHDSLKEDCEWLPGGDRHWTPARYWRKLNSIGRTLVACGGEGEAFSLPDLVVLTEVENDTVMRDLTRRSLLRNARYEYVMTDGPDVRGIDVALLYSPFSFRLLEHRSLRVNMPKGQRPTRDVLYVKGCLVTGDTLHLFAVHAPSRREGERTTRANRLRVAERIGLMTDSIRQTSPTPLIVVAGDFNDYSNDIPLRRLSQHHLTDVSAGAKGSHGASATYRFQGFWGSLDHVFVSSDLASQLVECVVFDPPFLLADDEKYGGVKPRRTFNGFRYDRDGTSDHLPLVARFRLR